MKTTYYLAMIGIVLMAACATTTHVTNFWRTPDAPGKSYNTIFVAAMVHNQAAKQSIENNLAIAAQDRGFKVIKSGDIFPPNFTKENVPSKEAILNKVRELGADAIFTMAVVDKSSETRYVPGSGPYAPYPAWGWYGSFWGYYNYWYPTMYNPGYYTTDKTYFLESNLYDAGNESLLFSVQSETMNPNSIDDFSKSYTKSLVRALEAQGLLKK